MMQRNRETSSIVRNWAQHLYSILTISHSINNFASDPPLPSPCQFRGRHHNVGEVWSSWDHLTNATHSSRGWKLAYCQRHDKTKEMIGNFSKGPEVIAPVKIANRMAEQVDPFKLLGCTINNKGTWSDHLRHHLLQGQPMPRFHVPSQDSGCEHTRHAEDVPAHCVPVVEICTCCLAHLQYTGEQSEKLEAVQRIGPLPIIAADMAYRQATGTVHSPHWLPERRRWRENSSGTLNYEWVLPW